MQSNDKFVVNYKMNKYYTLLGNSIEFRFSKVRVTLKKRREDPGAQRPKKA